MVGWSGVPGTAAPPVILPVTLAAAALSFVRTRTTGLAGTGGTLALPPPEEEDCRLGQAGARAATAAADCCCPAPAAPADPEELRSGVVVCGGAPVVPDAPETTEPDTEVFRPLWTEPPGLPGDGGGGGIGDWDMTYVIVSQIRSPPPGQTHNVLVIFAFNQSVSLESKLNPCTGDPSISEPHGSEPDQVTFCARCGS